MGPFEREGNRENVPLPRCGYLLLGQNSCSMHSNRMCSCQQWSRRIGSSSSQQDSLIPVTCPMLLTSPDIGTEHITTPHHTPNQIRLLRSAGLNYLDVDHRTSDSKTSTSLIEFQCESFNYITTTYQPQENLPKRAHLPVLHDSSLLSVRP